MIPHHVQASENINISDKQNLFIKAIIAKDKGHRNVYKSQGKYYLSGYYWSHENYWRTVRYGCSRDRCIKVKCLYRYGKLKYCRKYVRYDW